MQHSAESIFIIEYLCKYEFIFKTALAHESWGPGVLIDEKTEGRKSRDTVPLNKNFNLNNLFSAILKNVFFNRLHCTAHSTRK
jgi:hypothetical protein